VSTGTLLKTYPKPADLVVCKGLGHLSDDQARKPTPLFIKTI